MTKSVAIVGFASATMPFVAESKADEIWTMNHAYKVLGDALPRIDRLFEIHPEDWIRRKELSSAVEYWEWLKQPHDFPVYMMDVHPEVPASVRYPFDEINQALFSNFHTNTGDLIKFYTSSVSFMLAMAIYEDFDRIELYGVEMLSSTEYAYQYPGGAFMIGAALGSGIEVVIHEKSHLCKARLYAYEAIPFVDRPTLEKYSDFYTRRTDETEALAAKARDLYNAEARNGSDPKTLRKLIVDMTNAEADASINWGAMTTCNKLLRESDYWSSRQKLDGYVSQYRIMMEKWKAESNYKRAEYNAYLEQPDQDPAKAAELFHAQMHAWMVMHRSSGAIQALQKLVAECDLLDVDPELTVQLGEREAES